MKQLAPILLISSATILVAMMVLGSHGFANLRTAEREIKVLSEKNEALKLEVSDLKSKIVEIQHNPAELEKRAREELGYSRPGETIYLFSNRD